MAGKLAGKLAILHQILLVTDTTFGSQLLSKVREFELGLQSYVIVLVCEIRDYLRQRRGRDRAKRCRHQHSESIEGNRLH